MATDYDTPRKTDEELHEESLEELKARRSDAQSGQVDIDEEEAAEKGFPLKAFAAWRTWYDTTPDTPCIAICSTSQGDPLCKGCGRTFEEVQHWTEMGPGAKRQVWRRITLNRSSWRFNRYAERAAEGLNAVSTGE